MARDQACRNGGRGTGRHTAPFPGGSSRGSVLLETALAIPLLLAVTVALAWGLSLTAATMALGDAARQVAREVARGVPVSEAVAGAQEGVPDATIEVSTADEQVLVVVAQSVSAPVPVLSGISVDLSQKVVVPAEWS